MISDRKVILQRRPKSSKAQVKNKIEKLLELATRFFSGIKKLIKRNLDEYNKFVVQLNDSDDF
jgi:hypothetical protein